MYTSGVYIYTIKTHKENTYIYTLHEVHIT